MIFDLIIYILIIILLGLYLFKSDKPKIMKDLDKFSENQIKEYILHNYDLIDIYNHLKEDNENWENSYILSRQCDVEEYYNELVLRDYIEIELKLLNDSKKYLKKINKLNEFEKIKKKIFKIDYELKKFKTSGNSNKKWWRNIEFPEKK